METGEERLLAEVPDVPEATRSRTPAGQSDVEPVVEAVDAISSAIDLETVYEQDLGRLVGLAEWIVGSHAIAEEIVHDTFVRLVAKPPKLDEGHALAAYVRSAVVNGCRSKIRRFVLERKHRPTQQESYEDPVRPDDAVRQALLSLPLRQRQVVVLRFYEDLRVDQIAADLGISSGSVKTHLHRGLQRLAALLDERTLA